MRRGAEEDKHGRDHIGSKKREKGEILGLKREKERDFGRREKEIKKRVKSLAMWIINMPAVYLPNPATRESPQAFALMTAIIRRNKFNTT